MIVPRPPRHDDLLNDEVRRRLALHASGIGVWEWNVQTNDVYCSQECLDILGEPIRTLDEFMKLVHADDRDRVLADARTTLAEARDFAAEFRVVVRDNVERWLASRGRGAYDADGQPIRMVGTFQDITERKQLEAQLREAQKLEAIGQLAAGVAHDFNNLLTIICGYSDILLAQLPADDSKRSFIANIRKAGDRANGLTRQLLAFSRQTIQAPVVLDLNDLVRENERMLARLIGEDVSIITQLEPALPRIKVDPGQITQVIMNLAVNARDAMPQGGDLVIHTSTLDVDDELARKHAGVRPGQHVCLAIRDTGTGMSDSVLAHLFEPFFTTKGPGKGTGLGLAVVFGIATQAGGFIDVQSEVNVGTTIRVVLPSSVEKASIAMDTGASLGGTETVLLVEDEEQVLEFAALTLQGSGYRLHKAANGKKALALGDDVLRKIDLLVTDVVMPEMSGRQLAERLRQINPRFKVLFVSGYTDDAILRHGIHHADVRILQKPYTPLALARKVREALSARP